MRSNAREVKAAARRDRRREDRAETLRRREVRRVKYAAGVAR